MLIKDYYTVDSVRESEEGTIFSVTLNPDCDIYRGHFPGNPVSPGVCSVRIITECAETMVGKPLILKDIKQCRFTELVSPQTHPHLEVHIALAAEEAAWQISASITCAETVCLTLKGVLVAE